MRCRLFSCVNSVTCSVGLFFLGLISFSALSDENIDKSAENITAPCLILSLVHCRLIEDLHYRQKAIK